MLTTTEIDNRIDTAHKAIIRECPTLSLQIGSTHRKYSISDDFRNPHLFKEWYLSQVGYQLGYEVDKDLLIKGNKHYSFETCCLIPKIINNTISTSRGSRGSLPIGVYYNHNVNKYVSRCRFVEDGVRKRKTIGYYDTPEDAFTSYKEFKEGYIKSKAEEYRNVISDKAYQALINWIIEIDD